MKVAFLIHSLEVNSCRYRVLQYLPYLKEKGVDASVHFYMRTWADKLTFYNTLGQYDLLYIHRRLFPPLEFWYLRKKAKRIIYDFDDAVMYRSSGSKNSYSFSRRMRFAYMMKRVNFVVAGNQFLRSEVFPYTANAEIIPTSVDLSHYSLKRGGPSERPLILGWLGSSSTVKYMRTLMPVLENLYRKFPHFQLKMVCDQFLDANRLPVIKKRWSAEEEEEDLKSFDVGMMPLSDDLWSKGKCGLKILQYYSVGVPVVCTPVGVNRDIVEDGVNGFWATNGDEWEHHLLELMKDEAMRKKMGLRGRERVETGFSLAVNAPRLLGVLRKVLS
ncbi:MAG TPA: glycosyltransferase family 4 protein [Thermodesulfobacteriota bacterium]|nr:glycosyltransferase family 4 protein [Thermodesulfobacteriota bacterium]